MHSITGSDRSHRIGRHFDASPAYQTTDKGYPRDALFLLAQGPAEDALNSQKIRFSGYSDRLGFQGPPALDKHMKATYDLGLLGMPLHTDRTCRSVFA